MKRRKFSFFFFNLQLLLLYAFDLFLPLQYIKRRVYVRKRIWHKIYVFDFLYMEIKFHISLPITTLHYTTLSWDLRFFLHLMKISLRRLETWKYVFSIHLRFNTIDDVEIRRNSSKSNNKNPPTIVSCIVWMLLLVQFDHTERK
jgi:hypothetical protein